MKDTLSDYWMILIPVAVVLLLCVCVGAVVFVLALLGPVIGNTYATTLGGLECSYAVTVTVFDDENNDGSQNEDEPGVADAAVSIYYAGALQHSMETNDTGYVEVYSYANSCSSATQAIDVTVTLPDGTSQTYGPYDAVFYPTEPEVIEIGIPVQQ